MSEEMKVMFMNRMKNGGGVMDRIRFGVIDGITEGGQEVYEVVDLLDGDYSSFGFYADLDEAECAAVRAHDEYEETRAQGGSHESR